MRVIDGERQLIADLKEEGRVVDEKRYPLFQLTVLRHPTLGKLILIEGNDGNGAVVEADE